MPASQAAEKRSSARLRTVLVSRNAQRYPKTAVRQLLTAERRRLHAVRASGVHSYDINVVSCKRRGSRRSRIPARHVVAVALEEAAKLPSRRTGS